MNDKLVSVIIPTYNRGFLIRETINSVLNQTYQDFELFIIDDGSTDDTKSIVQSLNDERIKYYQQVHTGLPASGRNFGLKIASGNYIAFLDSDDLWFPRKLELQIKLLKKNPEILLIATNGIFFPMNPPIKVLNFKKNVIISFQQLLEKNLIINSSILMKKEVIKKIGFLDENSNLKYGEDYDYWLRLLKFKDSSIQIMKNILIKYRVNEHDLIYLYKNPRFFLKKYRILSHIYEKYNDLDKNHIKKLLREVLYNYRISQLRKENFATKNDLFNVLKNYSLKIDKKLFFLIRYLIFELKILNLIKKVKIFQIKIKYIRTLIYRILKRTF